MVSRVWPEVAPLSSKCQQWQGDRAREFADRALCERAHERDDRAVETGRVLGMDGVDCVQIDPLQRWQQLLKILDRASSLKELKRVGSS